MSSTPDPRRRTRTKRTPTSPTSRCRWDSTVRHGLRDWQPVFGNAPPRRRFLAGLDRLEARRHEFRHTLPDRRKIVRMAEAAGQAIDPPGAPQSVHQRARHEVITPEDVLLGVVRQRSLQDTDELQDYRIE